MEWTKIPTDLLQSRVPDKEILAITKYQMLWAMLERQPTEEICLRYMTSKQLQQVRDYASAIERRVNADIKNVENHRNRQKIFYEKNQTLTKKTDGHSDAQSAMHTDGQSAPPDKIREDKIREDKIRKDKEVYFPDELLNQAFLDYIAMRKKIKSPMTDRAIQLAIKNLENLSGGDNDLAIQILEQSIMNSWKGLFELKQNNNYQKGIDWSKV